MFKVNGKDTRTTTMVTHFTSCSSVSIVNFEHVIAGWEVAKYLSFLAQNWIEIGRDRLEILFECTLFEDVLCLNFVSLSFGGISFIVLTVVL